MRAIHNPSNKAWMLAIFNWVLRFLSVGVRAGSRCLMDETGLHCEPSSCANKFAASSSAHTRATSPAVVRFDGAPGGCYDRNAGWSSLVARWAHNPKVGGSNPPPATNLFNQLRFRLQAHPLIFRSYSQQLVNDLPVCGTLLFTHGLRVNVHRGGDVGVPQ